MALTPEEELELEQLKKEYDTLSKEYEVFKNPIQKPETGFLESAARGAAQGLTFDMADELTALAENTITGKPYEQALAESRAEYKAAEEEYPITTGLTGLAGGIAQGVGLAAATGGAGAAAGAAGTASKIGKLAKAALLPTVGKGALKNIGSATLSGATYGALQEYGASEKKGLEALEEVPMAAVTGAGIGGALGAAVEGVGKGVKSLSGFVSKQLDEGNLPRSFEKIRDLYRSGLKGKGYIASKETDRINKQVEDASKNAVDVIQKSLDDVREIKNTILNKVDQPIEVQSTLNKLRDDLILKAEEGLSDSPKALLRVEGLIKSKLIPEESTISAISANDLVNKLEDYVISNPESSAEIKKLLRDSINELKLNLRISLDPSDVYEVLKDRPDILKKYEYYVKDLTDEALKTGSLSEYEKEFFKQFKKPTAKQKQETEKELAETIKQLRKGRPKLSKETKLARAVEKLPEEEIQNILKDAGVILKESSKAKPLGQLDSLMHHILNASENLGGVTRADGTDLKRKFKIFDVLRGNTADTGTGQKAAMKYEAAISELEKANTKIAKEFKDATEDAIKELDNKKFLEGSKLGEGPRDSSALRQLVTAPAVATGLAANLAAQVSKRPEMGILRPTVAYLNSLKNKINDRLIVEPDNVFYKRIAQGLDDAINQKDETRRAAIMNTLMQYESVRKMLKEEKE